VQNAKMMKQLQQMQAKMAQMQEVLGQETIEGSAGGGAVRVTVNGHQVVTEVKIEPEALDDADLLADMVMAACNDALEKSRARASDQMSQLLPPGLPPGMF
jgi:DNA-binding YbaB/EbfC family protein